MSHELPYTLFDQAFCFNQQELVIYSPSDHLSTTFKVVTV